MGEVKPKKRPRASRSGQDGEPLDPQALLKRITTLESRVLQLERTLVHETAAEVVPAAPPVKPKPRCPGCHLPVETAARGRCPWCGIIFQAVALSARPRRKLG